MVPQAIYMLLLKEQSGPLGVELHDDLTYLLRWGDLVEYRNHRRRVHGRVRPYQFRSVEQLRYDFEKDVKDAQGS